MVIVGVLSIQINLRTNAGPVGVINDQWQASHSKAEEICLEKMLLERKHISDFEQVFKELDFRGLI